MKKTIYLLAVLLLALAAGCTGKGGQTTESEDRIIRTEGPVESLKTPPGIDFTLRQAYIPKKAFPDAPLLWK